MIIIGSSVAGSCATAQSVEDLLDEDFKIPMWYKVINVRGGVGYKDNVLLSSTGATDSGFWKSGLDVLIYRLPTHGWQFNFFATGDDLRYFDTRAVDNEQVAIAAAQASKELGEDWKMGLGANYIFQNQVFDVSTTQTNQFAIGKVFGHAATGRWSVRKDVQKKWIELELSALRQFLDAPLDDYWQVAPRLVLGWAYGFTSDLTLSYQWGHLAYDAREQVDAAGFLVPGTSLVFQQHTVEGAWHHVWDEGKRWHTIAGVGFGVNTDNGSGYFDFRNYRCSAQVKYRAPSWEINGRARLDYYDYPIQTVSPTDSSKRHKFLVGATLHVEKRVVKSLKVFADYAYDRSISNLGYDQYRANAVVGGLDWEF